MKPGMALPTGPRVGQIRLLLFDLSRWPLLASLLLVTSCQTPTPQNTLAPPHGRPIEERDGRTLLWADENKMTGEPIWFDVTGASVDPRELQFGIGRETIPPIDYPRFAQPGDALLLEAGIDDESQIIGHEEGGESKAYPLSVLNRHEIVNDTFGGHPRVVGW